MTRIRFEEVDKVTNEFGKKMVKASRASLTRSKGNASKSLWKSIRYRFENNVLRFFMEEYGVYLDRGVAGHGKGNYKPRRPRAIAKSLSGYKFKKGPVGPKAKASFRRWAAFKNILVRNDKGQFIKPSSANFLLRRSTGRFGIKPRRFFTNPWERMFPEYDSKLNKAVTNDINNTLDEIIKQ